MAMGGAELSGYPERSLSMLAFWLGLTSLFMPLTFLGLGPAAVVVAWLDLRAIDAGRRPDGRRRWTQAGLALGVGGTLLLLWAVVQLVRFYLYVEAGGQV